MEAIAKVLWVFTFGWVCLMGGIATFATSFRVVKRSENYFAGVLFLGGITALVLWAMWTGNPLDGAS